ncbi:hypothetical protein SLE2022_392170 [Rubroshorea leprosula]
MQLLNLLRWVIVIFSIFVTLSQTQSHPEQTQVTSDNVTIHHYLAKMLGQRRSQRLQYQETALKPAAPVLLAGLFCFIAASISSAGGVGGGGLFIPILTIVGGLDLKTASSFSAFMVTGGSVANVIYNLCTTSEKFGGKCLIDYDIALLSEPTMLLGVSIGVICNLVFPEWLITILFAILLALSTFKTLRNGIFYWKIESETVRRSADAELEDGVSGDGTCGETGEGIKSLKEPLCRMEGSEKSRFPWMKLGVLLMIWFSFFLLYLLRGNRYGQGITRMKPCGWAYWVLSLFQIPLAIAFTACILHRRKRLPFQVPVQQGIGDFAQNGSSKELIFPLMAMLAGILGGIFGIGGGMLISPLLLQVGVAPEVTAATCSFMVLFSSTMSAFQYLLLGMEHTGTALIFSIICFIASLLGLLIVQKVIQEFGRASVIVFSVGLVMGLSTVLMTSFGALDVWDDYISGKYMGFKPPC